MNGVSGSTTRSRTSGFVPRRPPPIVIHILLRNNARNLAMAETTHTGRACELTKMAALDLTSAGCAAPQNEGKEISPPIDDLAREEAAAFAADDEVRARPVLSAARKVVLGGVMMCTYFLSVSHRLEQSSSQSATVSSSLLIIPSLAADLQLSELAAQWVSSYETSQE